MRLASRRLALPLALLTATVLATGPALAQGGGRGGGGYGGGRGGGVDHGPDGPSGGFRIHQTKPITLKQFDAAVADMFRIADANRDGIVTLAEFNEVVTSRRDAIIRTRFKAVDTNHNGQIDEGEFIAWQRGMGAAALSENTSAEYDEIVPNSIGPELHDGEKDEALAIAVEPLNAVVIAAANTNYDAGMSLEELLAYEHARFDKADADKDGTLSREEIGSMRPHRGSPGGRWPG